MNNKHILDITLRLSQALDQNYDVVSMETVLSVITALEGTTITKEQLEATRLAKYINQLRRRTKCENLARRAKSLLKRWREMVGMQQSSDSAAASSVVVYAPPATAINSSTNPHAPFNMPVCDNAVSTSQLTNPQFSHQHYQLQQQYQSNVKQQQVQHQHYRSEPSSPVNLDKSNPNEFQISMSNPATGPHMPKSSSTNSRKKRKLEKNINSEPVAPQQPTSFANLITGLGSTIVSSRKNTRDKAEQVASVGKPVETFVIEHSSNSNSDLICIPCNNTVGSNFTSATDVPPVVIDLQDTNSSMNSLVSKDVTNASSTFYRNKISAKKSKKEKKRKDRNTSLRQNQQLQDDDQNTTTASYQQKQPSDVLVLDEKSHSACPTISNISEILSLSNSSMSSVFPSADAMSKNIFQPGPNELASSSVKMSKSDLTFAGKFKRNTSSASAGSNVINYNSDSVNTIALNDNSHNQNKFSVFGGIGTNSNDSSSSSRTSSFHDVVLAVKREASNSRQNIEDGIKHDVNEKSMSNMSNKGNSSTDNTFALSASNFVGGQHHQSIDLTKEFSSQKLVKTPKKRGRKKGSKGVDSVIAKETSLSSQMLLTSIGVAGKKVKTTKELYAEMESRKLRNVKPVGLRETPANSSSNWVPQQQTQQQKPVISQCPSLCSDIADSDSCTMTSEPSRDSGNTLSKIIGKRETFLDNNSNYSKQESELKGGDVKSFENNRLLTDENSVSEVTAKIKIEIHAILKGLAPPPSVKEIEDECFNSITPCSCVIEEVTVPADTETNAVSGDNNSKESSLNVTNSTNINEKETKQLCITIDQMGNMTETLHRTDNGQNEPRPQPAPPAKVKKSIFDLDFDDDDDPLKSIIADIEGKNFKTETEITAISHELINDKSELPLRTEDDFGKVDNQNAPYALNVPTSSSDNIVCPSYEIKFDPNCEAKNRFEIQTQKITKFHIDTLHNCYIPNVNGNWNHANAVRNSGCINYEDNIQKLDSVTDGYDVVPFYGSDINEQIVKDLSHVKFTKKFVAKRSKCQHPNEILFHIPFLGVSRIPDIDKTKLRSKDIKNLTLDEEKENVDHKLIFENRLRASALDTNDAKEKDEIKVDSILKVETSSSATKMKANRNIKKTCLKRATNHATLVKRSTIKRLKLAGNEHSLEMSRTDSSDGDNADELKLHKNLFYHEELCPVVSNVSPFHNECIFHISSCSSGCSSADEESSNESFNSRQRANSTSSSSSSSSSEHYVSHLQHDIIEAELTRRAASAVESHNKNESDVLQMCAIQNDETLIKKSIISNDDDIDYDDNDIPKENNRLLLSFNNIYNKSTRDENAEQLNKNHENNTLKQQLQNCDDYNNIKNNFKLNKYIDNKSSSVNNINNNNNSCSNNYSDTNVNISSSSCSENPTNPGLNPHHNNDNDVQIRPFKEYQTGIRAVDEDVNDDDGNNCGRLQQFKEWHEVLQLRSYNDELLTVLPYVVLE